MASTVVKNLEIENEGKTDVEDEIDEPIQAPKKVKEPKPTVEKIDRRKKGAYERTEKQNQAWENIKKKRDDNRAIRKDQKAKDDEENKKLLEEKIVKKAVSIKKKQILKEAVLNNLSSDEEEINDIPIEIVQKIRKKYPPRKTPIESHELRDPSPVPVKRTALPVAQRTNYIFI